jgi:hypothetical protein
MRATAMLPRCVLFDGHAACVKIQQQSVPRSSMHAAARMLTYFSARQQTTALL